jgi:hypothetical protein
MPNRQSKEEKEKARVKKRNLIRCRIWGNKGIKIQLWISAEIENLFKTTGTIDSRVYRNKKEYHKLYQTKVELQEFARRLQRPVTIDQAHSSIGRGGELNFSILRTKGLSEGLGKKFYLEDGLFSREFLEQWANALKTLVVKLYKNYCQPIDLEVEVRKREVC